MHALLQRVDTELLHLFQSLDFLPIFFMKILSFIGNIKIHLIVLLGLSLKSYLIDKQQATKWTRLLIQAGTLFSILYLLKTTSIRLRPEFSHELITIPSLWQRLFDNRFHSFPSSHAAIMGFWLAGKPKSLTIIMVTIFMCLSRVILLQHFPSDVLFGLLFGFLFFFFSHWTLGTFLDKKKASA